MPSVVSTFQTASTAALTGSTVNWGFVSNALTSDNSRAVFNPAPFGGATGYSNYLTVTNLTTKIPSNATITALTCIIEKLGGTLDTDRHIKLIVGGAIQDGTDNPSGQAYQSTDFTDAVTWTAKDFPTVAQLNATDFGVAFSANFNDSSESGIFPQVDQITMQIDYSVASVGTSGSIAEITNTMNVNRETVTMGGYKCLLGEALPAVSSSTAIFANAPAGTKFVQLTIRSQALSITFDGTTAATASVGNYYPADNTYTLVLNETEAEKARAIQVSATATGYITYWGIV